MEAYNGFPHRVTHCEDGAYRWTYDLKENGNTAPLRTMVGICLGISLPISIIMLVLIWQYGAAQALLSCGGFLALDVGLPALIWKLMPPDPSFKMTEEAIEAWPKGRGNNVHDFRNVRRVVMRPDIDCIRLHWRVTGLHVYVPREDYVRIRDFIVGHVPKDALIQWP